MGNSHGATADPALVAELTPAWSFYYFVMLVNIGMQTVNSVALLCWSAKSLRSRLGCRGVEQVRDPVAAVIPCYLPNEAPIIRETIRHLMGAVTHLDDLTVYIVYNTPMPMDMEHELEELARSCGSPGRRLVIHKTAGSTSKAQNLNEIIPLVSAKYIAIYDADHHPDPESLAMAVNHLRDHPALDCVQGSTYIRQGGSLMMRTWITSEFFMNYFVILPMLERVAGSGFFAGANGVWFTPSIKRIQFDTRAMTEDVDCSTRAILQHNMRFEFLPEVRSGELAPVGLRAFWKQRLRWAMGWDETTLKHGATCFRPAAATWRSRFAIFYVLIWRYIPQFMATIMILNNFALGVSHAIAADGEVVERPPLCVQRANTVGFYFFLFFIGSSYMQMVIRQQRGLMAMRLGVYFLLLPFWILFGTSLLGVSLTRVITGTQGKWMVTARSLDQALVEPESKSSSGRSSSPEGSPWPDDEESAETRPLVGASNAQTRSHRVPLAEFTL